ncbi:hypothetical protein MMC30_008622 [Trapelia coarctata]|nr:hypothetical protein [Trapelia coarctata]
MTTLHMGSKLWVVLNSKRVVEEIIAKRGALTHQRPYMPIASGLVSRDKRLVLQPTAQWTESRRLTHYLLSGSTLKTYGEWQEIESVRLLASYLYRPHQWYAHHYRYTASILHRIILGKELEKSTPQLDDLRSVTVGFIRSINASLIDFFPRLANLPKAFQPWHKHWSDMGVYHREVLQTWWRPVKQAIAEGTAPPSFVRDVLLHEGSKYQGTDEEAMYVATSVIAAGGDNPRMALNVFVMSAICHPVALAKAREEVDKVCGGNGERLPVLDDMAAMSYVCALLKEVLRWRPTVPIVPQHQLIQDLEFEGYFFPAGTNFVINTVAVTKDYDDPEAFKPERWLDGNEGNITHGLWTFGGGRRICVGYRLGQNELFLAFARLLYCFDFMAAGPYDSARLRHGASGEPFPVQITVRSKEHERSIIQEADRSGVLESGKMEF